MSVAENTLVDLGLSLPEPASPVAAYVSYSIVNNQVFISGQLPLGVGELSQYTGQCGKEFTAEQGKDIAHICGLNVIAQLKAACGGNLDKVKRCIKLGVFVNSTTDFTDHPIVANGASELMVAVFGEKGKHVRAAVGCSQLPLGAAVEVEAIFEIE